MSDQKRKTLLLPGMKPGRDIFRNLTPLLHDSAIVDWIAPGDAASISDYARKLADELDLDHPCDVLGVSFGGIVAQELAPLIGAEHCFVVSSICSPQELTSMNRFFGRLPATASDRLMQTAGQIAQRWPGKRFAATVRARRFAGEDGPWYRWASAAALKWNPRPIPESVSVVRIHGDQDNTFPLGHRLADHVIEDANHLLAVSHAERLAEILAAYDCGS